MKIIYVDSLFLLNFIINYLLLVITARVLCLPLRRFRYLIAAAVGGAYAVCCILPDFDFLTGAPMKLVLWGIISLISFGTERYLFRCALSFFCISAAFGGGVWALSMFWSGNASGFLQLDLRTMLLSFALCYAALSLVFSGKFSPHKKEVLSINISHRDKSVCLCALRDTGNLLRDCASGKAVLVCSICDTKPLFTSEEVAALENIDSTQALLALSQISGSPKFYPTLYRSIGVTQGFIPTFSPKLIHIDGKASSDYVVAISPQSIGTEEYSAII